MTSKGLKPVTSYVRDQHATTVTARHMWESGSLNWTQFMLYWFISFSEFTEFSESSAPFRKNSIVMMISLLQLKLGQPQDLPGSEALWHQRTGIPHLHETTLGATPMRLWARPFFPGQREPPSMPQSGRHVCIGMHLWSRRHLAIVMVLVVLTLSSFVKQSMICPSHSMIYPHTYEFPRHSMLYDWGMIIFTDTSPTWYWWPVMIHPRLGPDDL